MKLEDLKGKQKKQEKLMSSALCLMCGGSV